jgi:hypothetical protein
VKVQRNLLIALASLAFPACAIEDAPSEFGPQTQDAGITTDGGNALDSGNIGQGIPTMNGTWLLIHEQSNCVETLGLKSEALSVSAELIQMTQNVAQVREERTICSINLTRVLGLETTFPNEAAQAHQPNIIEDSYVSGNGVGSGYASGIERQIYGVNLTDPLTEAMPADREDPRLIDADEDGQPGITLRVNGGEGNGGCDMFIAQRAAIRYFGTFERPNLIKGTSVTFYAQSVLGATQSLCVAPRIVTANDPFSKFELMRIDGEGGSLDLDLNADGVIDCEEVNSSLPQLWTFREPNDTLCGGGQ